MEARIFHGNLTPDEVGRGLIGSFNRNDLRAQMFQHGDQVIVQIATRDYPRTGGQTALSVHIRKTEDGVQVQMGKQDWLGVAASLGQTAFGVWRNPWNLISRLDDLAQDIQNLQLTEEAWQVIEGVAQAAGASFELSERLKRAICSYCGTANLIGEPSCIACGAPLGYAQPTTCRFCGFVIKNDESRCPNCGKPVKSG